MPNPKRKLAKSWRGNRRAHDKKAPPAFTLCPRCNQAKLPHRVCPVCGYYRGQAVVKT